MQTASYPTYRCGVWMRGLNFAPKQGRVTKHFSYIPHRETGYFSRLVVDYLDNHADLAGFYKYRPNRDGMAAALQARSAYPTNRVLLRDTLLAQYTAVDATEITLANIHHLGNDHTYTVCTAHQPNLMTGYLYFVYKILHAIKLAEELSQQHPDCKFVPVYYMGSEDNDLDELGTFRFRGERLVWDGGGQQGAVGRMSTASLSGLLTNLLKQFGPPGIFCDELKFMVAHAYRDHRTVGEATRCLVNALFGRYGLVILDPDDARLKRSFIPVMRDELFHQRSYPIVTQQSRLLEAHYKAQAAPRPLNLFYLADQLRERIERTGDRWTVVGTTISWAAQELENELDEHPERFSPNVVLRGLFQESILPNIAFIGGGAEVAYWLQLKTLFEHYAVPYPVVCLRQSALWIPHAEEAMRQRLDVPIPELFKDYDDLVRDYLVSQGVTTWQTDAENALLEQVMGALSQKARDVDPTLERATLAALARMKKEVAALEHKMLRAEKKKADVTTTRLHNLQLRLFPNGSLQERIENFLEYYLEYGPGFLDTLLEGMGNWDAFMVVALG